MRSTYISMAVDADDQVRVMNVLANVVLVIGPGLNLMIESPSKAREIAAALLTAADKAEGLSGGEKIAGPARGEA